MINIGDAYLKVTVDKGDFDSAIEQINQKARTTEQTFRNVERTMRPLGMAFTGLGVVGLAATTITKNWNNTLSETLQRLKPVFTAATALGSAMLVLPRIIKSVRIAFDTLKVAGLSASSMLGIFAGSISAVGLLFYGLTQIFPPLRADTERWSKSLESAQENLKKLEDSGRGTSTEANILRTAIDDLTMSLSHFSKVGDDNTVTENNLSAAAKKLADEMARLDKIDGKVPDNLQRIIDSGSNFGEMIERQININIGDAADNVVELTNNFIALGDTLKDEAETIRTDAIKALEDYYGLQYVEKKSLMEQFQDEVDARKAALDEELSATRSTSNDIIKQYRTEYNAKVKQLRDETEATVKALQDQLDALDTQDEAESRLREDADDTTTEADLRQAREDEWTRKGKAEATEKLNDFLEDKARKLADRQREDAKESLQKQISDVQDAASKKEAEYQAELDAKVENENALLDATETRIDTELSLLNGSLETKRQILLQELNDAVTVQNQIRDNAIANINAVIQAQLNAASGQTTELPPGTYEMPNGSTYFKRNTIIHHFTGGGPILEDSFLVGLRSGRTWGKVEQGETILPKGGGDTTIAGNNFYIREEADIYRVAAELHRLRMLKGDFGKG